MSALAPARLIHVLRYLPPHEALGLCHRRTKRLADPPLDRRDAARGEPQPVEHPHGFGHVTVAGA